LHHHQPPAILSERSGKVYLRPENPQAAMVLVERQRRPAWVVPLIAKKQRYAPAGQFAEQVGRKRRLTRFDNNDLYVFERNIRLLVFLADQKPRVPAGKLGWIGDKNRPPTHSL
jgi:hypothetical protein